MKTKHILPLSILALALAGCGGGSDGNSSGSGAGNGNNNGGGTTVQPTTTLQGLWQSPAGASPSVSAIVLPDGQLWAVVAEGSAIRVLRADLAGQTSNYSGSGKSYFLGTSTVTNGTAATLAQFTGPWRDVRGPGAQNWNIAANGALTGTRTTGCTYVGQLTERAERKAVVDVNMTEDCAGNRVRLLGVATLNTTNGISMVVTTENESAAVALTLLR